MRIIKRSHLILLFCLVSAIQIWVPLSMIARREATLNKGTAYKFRTRPVDPYDAFRGRYVALSFESDLAIATNVNRFTRGETVYVAVEVATNGYAKLGITPIDGDSRLDWMEYARHHGVPMPCIDLSYSPITFIIGLSMIVKTV